MTATRASLVSALCLFSPPLAAAPPPRQPNAGELLRALDRLSVVGNVLYVAAHPDDENTRLLAYLANEKLVRAGYLSITRGDGGQNLIGAEQGPLLGLIRTQELLAARRIDGAEQLFTRARDFGYSKTPEETLSIWGKEAVLADVVFAIRRFRPDVIITRFPSHGLETHGHHTASAILAEEAFRAAADPSFHPEQVALAGTWQAKRILWNKSLFFAKPGEDLSAYLALDVGGWNPLLGVSYGEMAADSRSMHKSQGFGAARSRGPSPEYFKNLAGDPARRSILDGVDLTWARVKGSEKLAALLRRARAEARPEHLEAVVPLLVEAYGELDRLPDNPWKEPKRRELTEVIVGCAGLYADVAAAEVQVTPGGELAVTATALNRQATSPLSWKELRLPGGTVPVGKALAIHQPVTVEKRVALAADAELGNPYWLASPPGRGLYTVPDPALIGLPESPSELTAELVFQFGDRALSVRRPIVYRFTDPVAGERVRAVEVVPAVMVNPASSLLMFPDPAPRELKVALKAGSAAVAGRIHLELPPGFHAEPASLDFKLTGKGAEDEVRFMVRPPASAATGELKVVAEVDGVRLSRGLHRIDYPHIPIQTLLPEATVKLTRVDLARTRSHIGYIAGAGDEVAASLRQVGYEVEAISDEALAGKSLSRFDAIVVGVRAYNTNARLPFHHKKLMDYVSGGGTLVVQYNTNNRLSQAPPAIGPLPFSISQDRVTDENAEVLLATPAHPILTRPNRISAADFAGWVQERGLYFADRWDEKYDAILSMHDAGEAPAKGSLLALRHGKGAFIYTGLSFFRQLPAGVPGAFRLFANLLSYGR